MLNTSNYTVTENILQAEWIVEPVLEERKRSCDGRWLKRNVKLNAKRRSSDFNEMLAAESFENAA